MILFHKPIIHVILFYTMGEIYSGHTIQIAVSQAYGFIGDAYDPSRSLLHYTRTLYRRCELTTHITSVYTEQAHPDATDWFG